VPDQLAIPVHFPDSMQWDGACYTHVVNQFEIKMIFAVKKQLFQWNPDSVIFKTIMISDDEFGMPEFVVPFDPIQ
jgi:hypothetical protein